MFSQLGATGEVIAICLTLGVHILGGVALIWMLVRDSDASMKDWWPGDDDGGRPRDPQAPTPAGGGGGLPLPTSDASGVRLREPGVIADAYTRRERRPAHAPEREPAPVPRRD